jgi:hypothetical protein
MQWPLQTFAVLALVSTFASRNGSAQTSAPPDPPPGLRQLVAALEDLRNEVGELRRTVARLEFDRHQENIVTLRNELSANRAEQARLAELDRARQQDVRDIEGLLAQSDAPNRLDLESTRSDLSVRHEREIAQQTEAARVRENEVLSRLHAEEQLAKRLNEAWKFTKGEIR